MNEIRAYEISTSVVICGYTLDRLADIREAIQSLQTGAEPADEIIFVSDYNEKLLELVGQEFRSVRTVANNGPKGLSGARNTGVQAARGRYVAFLDDDAVAEAEWLLALRRQCDAPGVHGAVSRVDPLWLGAMPVWLPPEFLWTVGCTRGGTSKQAASPRNLSGGAMCVRRELFEKAGGFDPSMGRRGSWLPLSCEETEWCIRARKFVPDLVFMYVPEAVLLHKVPSARLTVRYFVIRCLAEGLSKARLVKLTGHGVTLDVERNYVLRELTRSIVRNSLDCFRGDLTGLLRTGAIILGLGAAVAGYCWGRLAGTKEPVRPSVGLVTKQKPKTT
jgi:GT2 family glycosyltransferase